MSEIAYRLKVDTPLWKKGAIFVARDITNEIDEEGLRRCHFDLLQRDRFTKSVGSPITLGGNLILDTPEWFEEVFQVTPEYMSAKELKKRGRK